MLKVLFLVEIDENSLDSCGKKTPKISKKPARCIVRLLNRQTGVYCRFITEI
jgi:hypothetical protein